MLKLIINTILAQNLNAIGWLTGNVAMVEAAYTLGYEASRRFRQFIAYRSEIKNYEALAAAFVNDMEAKKIELIVLPFFERQAAYGEYTRKRLIELIADFEDSLRKQRMEEMPKVQLAPEEIQAVKLPRDPEEVAHAFAARHRN